jgi:hypothetical protein
MIIYSIFMEVFKVQDHLAKDLFTKQEFKQLKITFPPISELDLIIVKMIYHCITKPILQQAHGNLAS